MPEKVLGPGPRRYSPPRQSVVRTFAQASDVTHGHAKQLISGNGNLWDRLEKFIVACRTAGREELLDQKMRPLLDLYFGVRPEPFGPHLLRAAVQADAEEDVARSDFQAGAITKEQYVRHLDREIARHCALRDALVGGR